MFNGKRENYGNFVKLIEENFENTRITESFEIVICWDNTQAGPKEPTKIINLFDSNEVKRVTCLLMQLSVRRYDSWDRYPVVLPKIHDYPSR